MLFEVLGKILNKKVNLTIATRLNPNNIYAASEENVIEFILTNSLYFSGQELDNVVNFNDTTYMQKIKDDIYVFALFNQEMSVPTSTYTLYGPVDKYKEKDFYEIVYCYNVLNNNSISYDEIKVELDKLFSENALNEGVNQLVSVLVRTEEDIKNNLLYLRNIIDSRRVEYVNATKRFEMAMVQAGQMKPEEIQKTIRNEFENILKHKKVETMTLDGNYIIINTVPLYIYEPIKENRYYLGRCKIKIDTQRADTVRLDSETHKDAYWDNSPHPHVDNAGYPCWGTADSMLAQMSSENQYYGMFITALNYLETCNIEDVAGASVVAWDKVDENGNIIEEGFYGFEDEDEQIECEICGHITHYDNSYVCEDCGVRVCEDCITEIANGEWICNNCIDENYFLCTGCNEYHHIDFSHEYNNALYCETCYERRTDNV